LLDEKVIIWLFNKGRTSHSLRRCLNHGFFRILEQGR